MQLTEGRQRQNLPVALSLTLAPTGVAGISRLADGRVMVTGGDDADRTSFYSASGAGGSWSTGPNMNIARGYQVGLSKRSPCAACRRPHFLCRPWCQPQMHALQASAVLSDGRVFTIGGSWSGGCCFPNKTGEVNSLAEPRST